MFLKYLLAPSHTFTTSIVLSSIKVWLASQGWHRDRRSVIALVSGLDHTCLPYDSRAVIQVVRHCVYLYHCLHHRIGLVTIAHLNTAGLQLRVVIASLRAVLEPEDTGSVSFFLHCPIGLLSVFSSLSYSM